MPYGQYHSSSYHLITTYSLPRYRSLSENSLIVSFLFTTIISIFTHDEILLLEIRVIYNFKLCG